MALVYPSDLDSMLGKNIASERQAEVSACIEVAQSWIARSAGVRAIEKEATNTTIYLSGCDAYGTELWLPPEVRPVWNSGSDLIAVTQDGITLSTAASYSAGTGVIVRFAETDKRVLLDRPFGWSTWGPSNVAVTCKVGYDMLGSAILGVPPSVWQLIREVAYYIFLTPSLMGKASTSKAGASISIERDLSPMSLQTLEALRGL